MGWRHACVGLEVVVVVSGFGRGVCVVELQFAKDEIAPLLMPRARV